MKVRIAATLVLALVLGMIVAPSALAVRPGDGDTKGPLCADIDGGAGTYDSATQTVNFRMETVDPSCAYVTYTLRVYQQDRTTFITEASQQGTGFVDPVVGPALFFTITGVPVPEGTYPCVSGSSSISGHQMDGAPDTGCQSLAPGQGGRFH
jgi:hypothetical protein